MHLLDSSIVYDTIVLVEICGGLVTHIHGSIIHLVCKCNDRWEMGDGSGYWHFSGFGGLYSGQLILSSSYVLSSMKPSTKSLVEVEEIARRLHYSQSPRVYLACVKLYRNRSGERSKGQSYLNILHSMQYQYCFPDRLPTKI